MSDEKKPYDFKDTFSYALRDLVEKHAKAKEHIRKLLDAMDNWAQSEGWGPDEITAPMEAAEKFLEDV